MEFLSDYGLFLAKTVTIVLAIGAVLVLVALGRRQGGDDKPRGHLRIHDLGEDLKALRQAVRGAVLDKEVLKAELKAEKADQKAQRKAAKDKKATPAATSRSFVLTFYGDLRASGVESLREEVTALLGIATPEDTVLVRLESPGGMVHGYGLAASQLKRLRDHGLKLTVSVDKVAASGGYMMACIAERIVAAPFAILGSIGVVAQIPNIHRLLKKHDIDVELHTAGEYKRTLTVLGENTDKAREKFRAELEETHVLFKQFVAEHRPSLDLDKVATGEHWYGTQAKALGLVDEVKTSDDLLLELAERGKVFEVRYIPHKKWSERLSLRAEESSARLVDRLWAAALRRPEY